ncbi:MAG: DUF3108 domain-containing protein [Gammaproteobacteria bacterium]
MRTCLTKFAISILLLPATTSFVTASEEPALNGLQEYTAVYALRRGSLKAGEATFTLRLQEDGSYLYQSVTKATGLVAIFRDDVIRENVRIQISEDRIRPVNYEYIHENTNKNRYQSIEFDWHNMVARSNNRGTESSHELNRFTVDRASLPLIVGYALAHDNLPSKYTLLDHGKEKNYRMAWETGKELRTKAGRFNTVFIQRKIKNNDRQLRIWLSPDKHYLPIRIENEDPGGDITSLELLKIDYGHSG